MTNRVLAPERSWADAPHLSGARFGRVRALAEQEALPIALIACWVTLLAIEMPRLVVSDTWLALVSGREVAQHGLPHTDPLTTWTLGRSWIDQQWGAQLILYRAAAFGGLRAALLLGVGCTALALIFIAFAARRLGASSRSTAIGVALPLLCAPWLAQVRSQTFAVPLFVAVYALLAADSRVPSRRVVWTVPLLVAWANLHGSVALGAGLVGLHGLALIVRRTAPLRGALLVTAAPLTLLASPYGLHLIHYYRVMLLHPPLAKYVSEWQPATVERSTVLFFSSILLAALLWSGQRRRVSGFERVALSLLLVAALAAIRNAVWFELALALALPRLLDGAWPSRIELTRHVRRLNLLISLIAVGAVVVAFAAQAARPPSWFANGHHGADATTVAAAAGPNGIVVADQLDSDWLLWDQPSLAGRVAYDVRFELMNARQLTQLALLGRLSDSMWRRCVSDARIVTFSAPQFLQAAEREHVLAPGSRVVVRTPTFVAVQQPLTGRAFCRL